MRLSPHLDTTTDKALVCQCGCGMGTRLEHWCPDILELFENCRSHVGRPLSILSAWRCPRHNAAVSKAERSQHAIGAALDLACPKGMDFPTFAGSVEYAARTSTGGKAGVGLYPKYNMVHVDLGIRLTPGRRWTA